MKIVIDIPKKTYKEIKEGTIITYGETFAKKLVEYIRNSTPLSEHHGRLIDADDLYENTEICHSDIDGYACVRWKDINDAPTIIEAEGSESE